MELKVRIVMSGGHSRKRMRNANFFRENSGEQQVEQSAFLRLSKSLKSKILVTMVSPPGCTGFITNLPF